MIENNQYEKHEYNLKKIELLKDKAKFDEFYSTMRFNPNAQTGCEDVEQTRVVYNIKQGRNVMYS